MILILTLFLSFPSTPALQDPTPPAESARGGADIVRLKIGSEIAGRITAQNETHVFVELSPGEVVGFSMDQVDSILRGASAKREEAVTSAPTWCRERDDWYALHDAKGQGVGHMHETVTVDEQGDIRLGEEWRFSARGKVTEITRLEVCAPDGAPRSAFCHERTFDSNSKLLGERLVRAVVDGDALQVTVRSEHGDERKNYTATPAMRWPLQVRAELRSRRMGAQGNSQHEVYDALSDCARATDWDIGSMRRVPGPRGDVMRVRVLRSPDGEEWLDASGRTLRREVNGPALVAIPSTEADARRAPLIARFPVGFQAEPGGRFAMWLPNPAWSFEPGGAEGQISARNQVEQAGISLMRFEHLDGALSIDTAIDAVVRWLVLVQPDLRVASRGTVGLRGATAGVIRADFVSKDSSGSPCAFSCVTYVVKEGDAWYAACGSAPRGLFAQVSADIDWIASRFEFDPRGFAPDLAGPLPKATNPTRR